MLGTQLLLRQTSTTDVHSNLYNAEKRTIQCAHCFHCEANDKDEVVRTLLFKICLGRPLLNRWYCSEDKTTKCRPAPSPRMLLASQSSRCAREGRQPQTRAQRRSEARGGRALRGVKPRGRARSGAGHQALVEGMEEAKTVATRSHVD